VHAGGVATRVCAVWPEVLEPTDDEVQLPLHACVRHALCMWQRAARALCLLVNKNYFTSFPFFG
jgi:hypothetical protein